MPTAERTGDELEMPRDPELARSIDSDVVRTTDKPKRLLSIDVLRGLTIAFMILVNNQPDAGAFWPLKHAAWNGFTPTDLVFPTFLLLVGLSLVLSTATRRARGVARSTLWLHILRRSFVLCLFGFVVNNFPFTHLASARYYGVLPRLGICYLVVGTLYLFLPGWKDKVVLAAVCLAGYWALMRFVPVPGFGVPTHGIPINDMNGNLTAYIDRMIFAPQHLYEKVRDPEGLLSTIPAIATAIFGLLAGIWLRTARPTYEKARALAFAALALIAAGALWNPFFPINKKLWTSSFVLFAGGLSLLLLALAIYVTDIKRLGRKDVSRADAPEHPTVYKPLLVFGTNSILAYMISELLDPIVHMIHTRDGDIGKSYGLWLHRILPMHGVPELCFGLTIVLVTWLAVLPLYRRRIFLRI